MAKRWSAIPKTLAISVSIAMAMAVVATACATAQPAPAAAPAAAPAKVVELRFASVSAPTNPVNAKIIVPWIEQMDKATNGRMMITLFPSGGLGTTKDGYDLGAKGIADISYGWLQYHPGRFPLSEVYTLPGVVSKLEDLHRIWDVYEKYLRVEWTETKVLWLGLSKGFHFFSREKQIRTIDDVKGMKVASPGAIPVQIVQALGGVPVDLPAPDTYMPMQRGTIDAVITSWPSAQSNKLGEVARYYTNASLYPQVFYAAMNLDSYKALPDDLKKVLEENTGRKMVEFSNKGYAEAESADVPKVLEVSGGKGVIYDFTPEETQRYRTAVAPIIDSWVQKTAARGLPAKETLDMVLSFTK